MGPSIVKTLCSGQRHWVDFDNEDKTAMNEVGQYREGGAIRTLPATTLLPRRIYVWVSVIYHDGTGGNGVMP